MWAVDVVGPLRPARPGTGGGPDSAGARAPTSRRRWRAGPSARRGTRRRGVWPPAVNGRARAVHLDAAQAQHLQELGRGQRVVLRRGDHERVRVAARRGAPVRRPGTCAASTCGCARRARGGRGWPRAGRPRCRAGARCPPGQGSGKFQVRARAGRSRCPAPGPRSGPRSAWPCAPPRSPSGSARRRGCAGRRATGLQAS